MSSLELTPHRFVKKLDEHPRDLTWRDYVRRIGHGDHSAIAALYDESKSLVYSLARRIVREPNDADEVAIDVYLQVWRLASRYDERRGSVYAWLVMLTRSRAIDRIRAGANVPGPHGPIDDGPELEAPGPNPEQANLASETRMLVRRALQSLPHEQRRAVQLAFFSGLTHRELAMRLGQPLGTVKSRIRHGLLNLREAMGAGFELHRVNSEHNYRRKRVTFRSPVTPPALMRS